MHKLIEGCPLCSSKALMPLSIEDDREGAIIVGTVYHFKCNGCGEVIEIRTSETESLPV